jgi:histidinol-phosphate aminotransferase
MTPAETWPEWLPLRDDLRGVSPYGAPMLDVPVVLNVNENPHPPSASLIDELADAVRRLGPRLHRYPDREAVALRADLADYVGAAAEQVWAANGSNEVLQQICQAFGGPGRTALGFDPSYSMHGVIARGTGTRWVTARRAEDFTLSAASAVSAVAEHRPDVVFLCAPNNPTASALPREVVCAVLDAASGVVVVDEAYAEFSALPSSVELVARHPRLLVTRTMSKAFSFAGCRLGYVVADPAVVSALRLVRLPYHLSSLTQEAARVALKHSAETLATVRAVLAERDRVVAALRATPGLGVPATDANFFLFGPFADPSAVWQSLLDRGVLVRDVSSGPGLAGWLRANAGLPRENDVFLAALDSVLEESA